MTLLPKFTAIPAVNRLKIIGQYLGRIKFKIVLRKYN